MGHIWWEVGTRITWKRWRLLYWRRLQLEFNWHVGKKFKWQEDSIHGYTARMVSQQLGFKPKNSPSQRVSSFFFINSSFSNYFALRRLPIIKRLLLEALKTTPKFKYKKYWAFLPNLKWMPLRLEKYYKIN